METRRVLKKILLTQFGKGVLQNHITYVHGDFLQKLRLPNVLNSKKQTDISIFICVRA